MFIIVSCIYILIIVTNDFYSRWPHNKQSRTAAAIPTVYRNLHAAGDATSKRCTAIDHPQCHAAHGKSWCHQPSVIHCRHLPRCPSQVWLHVSVDWRVGWWPMFGWCIPTPATTYTELLWCRTALSMFRQPPGTNHRPYLQYARGQHAVGVTSWVIWVSHSTGILRASIQATVSSDSDAFR